jgi:hypothetical protein
MITLDVAGTNFARLGHNSASGTNILDVRSEGHMRFLTNGNNERFRITDGGIIFTTNATAAGSLGVGTDSPGKVSGMSRYLSLSAAAADNAVGFELQGNRGTNDSPVARFSFINDDTETARITVDSGTGGGASSNMIFATGGTTERLRIKHDGNVGVGTDDPYYKLHLKTNSNATSLSGGTGGNWGSDGIRIENFNNTAGSLSLAHFRNFDADWHIGGKYVGANDSDFLFFAEGDEKLRITSTGRIGIGTDDPQGLLVIQGDSNDSTTPSIRLQDGTDARQVQITCTSGDFLAKTCGSDNNTHGSIKIFESGIISLNNGGASGSNTERLRVDVNGNFIFKNGALIENGFHDDGGGITGDYNHDLGTYGNVHYAATNPAGSYTYNLRINSSTSVNSVMAEGDTLSFTFINNISGNTGRYMTAFKIDGTTQTVEWAGGSGPSENSGSGSDVYSFTIIKTGDAAFKVFGSFTNHD